MKKIYKLVVLLISIIILCSCQNKEYKLIELTSQDLATIIEGNDDIIFATLNSNLEDSDTFQKDLTTTAKAIKSDIYYIDASKTTFWADESIYIYTNVDTRKLYYYARKEGSLAVANSYVNQRKMYESLKDYKSADIKIPTSDKEKQASLKEAQKYYEKGLIASSYQKLAEAWTLKEAKEYFNNHKYYQLINTWEIRDIKKNKFYYQTIALYGLSDSLYYYDYNGSIDDFTDPPKASDYSSLNYYVKDDKIYVSDEDTEDLSKYQEKYQIISLDNNNLILKEKNKEYKFTKKSN